MFVIFRTNTGQLALRPAYIGFIKNNALRRTLCTAFYPVSLLATILFNLAFASIYSAVAIFKAIWVPVKGIRPIWKSEIWDRPRTKNDSGRMH